MTITTRLALLDELAAKDAEFRKSVRRESAARKALDEHREYYEGVIADGSKRIAELERSETQLIHERDNAEEALADIYQAATGERPEWSNIFGFADAVDAVEERLSMLEARTVVGWLRADCENITHRITAPLFVMGRENPSEAWELDYVPLSQQASKSREVSDYDNTCRAAMLQSFGNSEQLNHSGEAADMASKLKQR